MPLLFDSSAMTNIIISHGSRALEILKKQYVLDLTFYEIGNALWKLATLTNKLTQQEAKNLVTTVTDLINWMNRITVVDLHFGEIIEVAIKESVTFYDSAYLTEAKKRRLMLITDDNKLAMIALKYVKTKSSHDL